MLRNVVIGYHDFWTTFHWRCGYEYIRWPPPPLSLVHQSSSCTHQGAVQ